MTLEYNDYADIRGVFGDQRKGKSTIATMFSVDDYISKMTRIIAANGEYCDARCLTGDEIERLHKQGIKAHPATHCMIFNANHSQSKIIEFPKSCMIDSPVKIFANYTLYGVYYVHLDLELLITYINTDLITDAWVLMDETGANDARNSMTREGKLSAQFGAQAGKRGLHLVTIAQYLEQIERRYRLFKTTTIEAKEYDKINHIITCDFKFGGEPTETDVEIYAKPYHRYFNTKEIIKMPQHQIDAALANITGSR